jgi:hypothetical protein
MKMRRDSCAVLVTMFGLTACSSGQSPSTETAAVASEQAAAPAANPGVPGMAKLFDISIPQATREQLARKIVVGKYHGKVVYGDKFVQRNLSLNEDGTWSTTYCLPFGEASERKFNDDGHGTWEAVERRYTDTGMIYYQVVLKNWESAPEVAFDRTKGLQILNFGAEPTKALPGYTDDCGP